MSNVIDILALVLAVIGFWAGLAQYRKGQAWKRREFVANEMDKILASAPARNALKMLDYTLRWIDLLPESPDPNQRFVRVSRAYLAAMLIPHGIGNKPHYGIQGAAIRDCFDDLLTRLDNLHAMIVAELIQEDDVKPYLQYWVRRLVEPHSKAEGLDRHFHRNLWFFIETYNYHGVQKLCKLFDHDIKPKDNDLKSLISECAEGLWRGDVEEFKKEMKGKSYLKRSGARLPENTGP